MSTRKPPYTVVEIVEEMPPGKTPKEGRFVKIQDIIINGKPVTVAQDGMHIACDPNKPTKITLELLVDEFHIHRVPHGYTDGISEWEAELLAEQQRKVDQVVEHFDDGHIRFKTKPEQPRDHLGRFTKRK